MADISSIINNLEEIITDWETKVQGMKELISQLKAEVENEKTEESQSEAQEAENEKRDEHFSWIVEDDVIKATYRRYTYSAYGECYTQNIPLVLLKAITLQAYEICLQRGTIKTGDILKVMKETIVSESNYKKCPEKVVGTVFRILCTEKIMKECENSYRRYSFNNADKEKIKGWVDSLDGKFGYVAYLA